MIAILVGIACAIIGLLFGSLQGARVTDDKWRGWVIQMGFGTPDGHGYVEWKTHKEIAEEYQANLAKWKSK
jgi:hypothetical protein